jgi:hypothetical protein
MQHLDMSQLPAGKSFWELVAEVEQLPKADSSIGRCRPVFSVQYLVRADDGSGFCEQRRLVRIAPGRCICLAV